MNCQDFESLAGDLTRGVPVEARAREEARAHEAECPRCAARLADERALSAGLRAVAAAAVASAPPAGVEANLLAAFRAQAARRAGAGSPSVPGEPAPAAETVLPFARPATPARRWTWVKTAAASATATAAAVTLFILVAPSTPKQLTALTPPTETSAPPPATPVDISGQPQHSELAQSAPAPPTAMAPRVIPAVAPRRLTTTPVAYRGQPARAPRAAASRPAARGDEIATSFIPLTQDAASAAADGGQVVRVELPRTALQRFGLPMNVERAEERVKADVLFGHDGVARAIRFVR